MTSGDQLLNLILCCLFTWHFFRLLHYVAANPDLSELLEMLVEKDADVNALNTDAMSPLFFAAKSSCIYNANVLIANGT